MHKKRHDPPPELASTSNEQAFTRDLDLVEGFEGLRASDEELDRLGSLLADRPDTYQPLFAEVNEFAASLAPMVTAAHDWSRTDAQTLALLVCGWAAVRHGVRTCALTSLALPSTAHQLGLYLIILHSRALSLDIHSSPWVRLAVALWVLGPRGVREVTQRVKQHVGVGYGLAAYLWNKPEEEEELRALLKELQWLSNRHFSNDAHRTIHNRPDMEGAVVPELGSALGRVLDQRKLLSDPLHGLLKALDGKLNVFPKAVANQLTKDLAPISRHYRTIEVTIKQVTEEGQATRTRDGDEPISALEKLRDLNRLSALDELVQHEELDERDRRLAQLSIEVTRLRAQSAKHRVGYAAFLGEQSKVELAKQHRKDPATIARWEKNFLVELRSRLTPITP